MKSKKVPTFKDLPFEIGKTYKTKFQTGELFKVTRDPYKRLEDGTIFHVNNTVYGIYEKSPHLGECGLSIDRLIPDRERIGEICVCGKCGTEIEN